MAEDLYAKPDLTKKVRFQTAEKKDKNTDDCTNVDNVVIYDNYWAQESTPPQTQDKTTEDQQQTTSVSANTGERNLLKAAGVFLGLLCFLLMAALTVLVVQYIQDKSSWGMERHQLWVDRANLTGQRDELQRRYHEMKSLNHNLTQKTRQLESENNLLEAIKSELVKERDDLQKHINTTSCPDNWIKFGNSCYSVSSSQKTWSDSKVDCEGRGAQLVVISSIEEQKFISSFHLRTWIGLTDEEHEDTWKWVDGSEATTMYWKPGQPDNAGPQNSENCVQNLDHYPKSLGSWNDISCSNKYYFICEKTLQ